MESKPKPGKSQFRQQSASGTRPSGANMQSRRWSHAKFSQTENCPPASGPASSILTKCQIILPEAKKNKENNSESWKMFEQTKILSIIGPMPTVCAWHRAGERWLGLLTLLLDGHTLQVRTFSPHLLANGGREPWRRGADHWFTLRFDPVWLGCPLWKTDHPFGPAWASRAVRVWGAGLSFSGLLWGAGGASTVSPHRDDPVE